MKMGIDYQACFAPVASALEGATASGVLWQSARSRFLLDVPDVARYLVSDGAVITIDRVPGARDEDVARFLHMTPLAALLYQRGCLAFHAAAAVPPSFRPVRQEGEDESGAILIAGDSGAGKSTLLAVLLKRGWRMLGDELAPVDVSEGGEAVVHPTVGPVRLWPDAREELGIDRTFEAAASTRISTPIPLRTIFWLSVHHQDGIESSELTGAERFRAIGTLSYNSRIADASIDRIAYFRHANAIVRTVPIHCLRRPRGRWSVEDLAKRIDAHSPGQSG
jgi:hypothetical protein